ncbi:CHAT domain-containing protein, partial [Halomicronema sp. CCY15110]|uniref:CHAT domain-containing protein n=1 Tax=Halomicronema sp. CCY15110 TaxID=2767773 RepID=UPI0019521B51
RIRGDKAANIEQAITAYQQALTVMTPDTLPNECRKTARLLANLYADEGRWADAISPYTAALAAAEVLYQSALSQASQASELSETSNLYRRAAYAYAKAGDRQTAVATIEQGRARSLRETLQRDRADLTAIRQINPQLVERYAAAAATLRNLEVSERSTRLSDNQSTDIEAALRQQGTEARQTLQTCIAEIRQIPGYDTFLALPTFADIAATLQPAQSLVYLIPTPNGTLTLIFQLQSREVGQPSTPTITPVWLDSFTESELRQLLVGEEDNESTGWFKAYYQSVLTPADNPTLKAQNRERWFKELDRITNYLWDAVMAPILLNLSPAPIPNPESPLPPTATLIPTGYLSFLPLHAAWTPDDTTPTQRRYACDSVIFTYAPNAQALDAARTQAHTPATTLLAIDEPLPCTAPPLPNSAQEVAAAVAHFPQHQVLRHTAATREAVLAALPQHPVWHFSCHGSSDPRNPLDNGLLLSDGQSLSLRDLLALNLKEIRLAVLSACETGMPGAALPDEVVSLPTGLLQAGVAGVVASLWSVSDLSTMMLLSRFYDFWRVEQLPPHQALHQAQLWLRDTPNGEKVAYFKTFLAEFQLTEDIERMAATTADYLYKATISRRPQENDFEHPYHWAAFTYVGT